MNSKLLTAIIVVVVLVGAGYFFWSKTDSTALKNTGQEMSQTLTYEDSAKGFRFEYPAGVSVMPITTREVEMIQGAETVPVPPGSLRVGEVVITPLPDSEISEGNSVNNFFSCCTGVRYWYDAVVRAWHADDIKVYADDGAYKQGQDQFTPHPLMKNDVCEIAEAVNGRKVFKVVSGDEGVPEDIHYFVHSDSGYVVRVLSPYDFNRDYSSYPEELKPDPTKLQTAAQILASVGFIGNVKEITPSCI